MSKILKKLFQYVVYCTFGFDLIEPDIVIKISAFKCFTNIVISFSDYLLLNLFALMDENNPKCNFVNCFFILVFFNDDKMV